MSSTQIVSETYWSDLQEQAEERESESDHARFYGMRGEEYAFARFDLVPYRSSSYDALTADKEHRVQIKSARLKISNGDHGSPGRFRLWEVDHQDLDPDDKYLFQGYDPEMSRPVRRARFIDVGALADEIDGINWYGAGHETKSGQQTKISVKAIFPDL